MRATREPSMDFDHSASHDNGTQEYHCFFFDHHYFGGAQSDHFRVYKERNRREIKLIETITQSSVIHQSRNQKIDKRREFLFFWKFFL